MSEMRWGQPTGRYEDAGHGRRRYVPPRPDEAFFRGRAGVVIEVAPQQFVSYVMASTFGEVSITTDHDHVHAFTEPLIHMPTSREVHMVLTGQLSSMEEQARRPAWATGQHEIEARRELRRAP